MESVDLFRILGGGWLEGLLSLLKFSAFIWGRTDFPRICEELVLRASEKLPNIYGGHVVGTSNAWL
jgi:hypothetical protein